jgi:YD repeat-containing protein
MSENVVQNPDGGYTLTDKYGNQDVYDEKGRLVKKMDAKGNSLVIIYTAQARDSLWGLLLTNLDQYTPLIVAYDYKIYRIEERNHSGNPTGAAVTFQYDSNGRLTSITDGSRTITYGHDSFGNLTSASGPGVNATYGYTNHRLTSVDEGQGEYVNTYDSHGWVTKQVHGTGVIDLEYLIPYKKTRVGMF